QWGMGGLNLHLTHHLFPDWSHRHYPALADLIAHLAPEHSIPYQRPGLRGFLREQQAFLRRMGARPDGDTGGRE
ncbi:MAG TPA: fatty acid desaturase, partial [Thiomonas arsenitoxydans]|nr:fatty acid desaturase [Thiomonas arsenitoxydans]